MYDKELKNKNFGLIDIQIIFLTKKINSLNKHFIDNKKDYHSKRGLIIKISKRKKLLKYLKKNNFNKYINLISYLKLKK